MTDHDEPDERAASTSRAADRRSAFATRLMAMPDVGDDSDFERWPRPRPSD